MSLNKFVSFVQKQASTCSWAQAMGMKGLLFLSVALAGAAGAWADNCGVPSGAAPLSDGMWQQWHNRLSAQIQQQDSPDVRTCQIRYAPALTIYQSL